MKIGIFETEHFEGVFPVIRLFDRPSNEITVFTYQESYNQLKHLLGSDLNRYDWVIKNQNESIHRFIYTIFREVKKKDIRLLYLNTVTNNFIFYTSLIIALPRTRVILTLHDINGYFRYKPEFGLRPWVRYVGKRWLINKVNEFNVVSLPMVEYLKNRLSGHKEVYCVPGAVFDESAVQTPNGIYRYLNIVVPGILDRRRRNYDLVFDLLSECRIQNLPIVITLLGGVSQAYGQEILQKCKAYAKQFANLRFYDTSLVDQPEFDRVMNEADLVLIPSTINTVISDGVAETYGISISSGNLFDVIRHAKPFIIPGALEIDPFLQQSCFRYNNVSDIVNFLSGILQDKEQHKSLLQSAIEASRNYTIDKIRKRNPGLFDTQN